MVSFGLMFRPGHFPLSHMLGCIKAAENAGFDNIWFGDSHLIWHEVGPYLTAAAMSTKRMRVGPLVSNPVTRHPTVVASMLATLGQLFDGRAVLGVGRGDSAVRTLGLPPMKLAEFRDALRLMRQLCRGDEAQVNGSKIRFAWLKRPVPVLLAAYGPRVLELAGAEADGLILQLASPSGVEWRENAAAAPKQRAGATGSSRRRRADVCYATARALPTARLPATVSNPSRPAATQAGRCPRSSGGHGARRHYDYRTHGRRTAHTRAVTDDMAAPTMLGKAEDPRQSDAREGRRTTCVSISGS